MKEIRYRGGMLTFFLPDSWQEEYGADGGAAFFAGDSQGGTLNLRLTTIQRSDQGRVDEASLREVVTTGVAPGDPPAATLPTGNVLQRYERSESNEEGRIHLTFWSVANAVQPKTIRYALFGFAVPGERAGSPEHQATVELLDERIRAVEFTTLSPEEIQAKIAASRRPWWKFW